MGDAVVGLLTAWRHHDRAGADPAEGVEDVLMAVLENPELTRGALSVLVVLAGGYATTVCEAQFDGNWPATMAALRGPVL